MYKELIESLNYMLINNGDRESNPLKGNGNTLSNGSTKLVSKGNIVFEGTYMNAEIMEKKKSFFLTCN